LNPRNLPTRLGLVAALLLVALAAPALAQDPSPPTTGRATGDARRGVPRPHLQIHPGGGDPVNPYGLLKVVSDLSRSR